MTIAHQRKRHVISAFLKKMKFSPIVSLQGPRQCGKSYFARELVPKELKNTQYYSLDKKEHRSFATSSPFSFLNQTINRPLIIDEAQKAPDLFDEVKAIVDEKRTPGQFVLLGSTEFSLESSIKESLTGRLSRLRLYPFNLSESLKLDPLFQKEFPYPKETSRANRFQLMRYLERGGFPGIFNVNEEAERKDLLSDWISLTVERDIHQFKKFKLDSEIAIAILTAIAQLDEANSPNIAKQTRLPLREVSKYIKVFRLLFVIFEVLPFKGSTGKEIYFLTDVGLLTFFQSSFEKKLLTWFYLEIYSQLSYSEVSRRALHYYRTTKGKFIDIVFELDKSKLLILKLLAKEGFDTRDFLILESFKKKYEAQYSIKNLVLSGTTSVMKFEQYKIYPWESLA